LGLPTIEETRRRQEQEEAALRDRLREQSALRNRDEAYWRERARVLRSEITTVDAQINYLRAQLSELHQFPLATHSLVTSVLPLVPLATRSAFVPLWQLNPGTFGAPRTGLVHGLTRGRVFAPASPFRGSGLARPIPGVGFPFGVSVGSTVPFGFQGGPFDYVEDSYARTSLSERLEDLLVTRAALSAQWLQLEDEARDVKIPQIWLEP